MNPAQNDNLLLNRIIDHFNKIAPVIVKESVSSLKTDHPIIDYYDVDFYLEKLDASFDNHDPEELKHILTENVEEINAIFFKNFKEARADNY